MIDERVYIHIYIHMESIFIYIFIYILIYRYGSFSFVQLSKLRLGAQNNFPELETRPLDPVVHGENEFGHESLVEALI